MGMGMCRRYGKWEWGCAEGMGNGNGDVQKVWEMGMGMCRRYGDVEVWEWDITGLHIVLQEEKCRELKEQDTPTEDPDAE